MADDGLKREDGTLLQVGDRVFCDDHRACIRFIGEVPPTKGTWLGVDWDDPERGKHDGSHNGKQYFQTRHPKSGSFVRSNKVNGGITAVKALHERYGLKNEGDAGVITEDLFVVDEFSNEIKVEMVGAKKVNELQSQFDTLKSISFFGMKVYSAGPAGELGSLCPRVTELEMVNCLISSWERVAEIARELPCLKCLDVSENYLELPNDALSLKASFAKLKRVTLNRMSVSWEDIVSICKMFPVLEELYVGFNGIASLSECGEVFSGLKLLDVTSNEITDWAELLKLGNLQSLESLNISMNQIPSIYFPDSEPVEKSSLFPKLKIFIAKKNNITEWSSINALNKLQSLEEVLIASNPVLMTYNFETIRQVMVAKIGSLKLLNRIKISYEERKGAEIDYLKRFGKEWRAAGGHSDPNQNKPTLEFLQEHPRYTAMAEKWGAPEDSELAEKSTALKDNLIAVTIESSEHAQKGKLSKKLPATMSIEKLKTLIQRLFKMHTEPQLSYISHKMTNAHEIPLDNDMRILGFFSIESGDTIVVKW